MVGVVVEGVAAVSALGLAAAAGQPRVVAGEEPAEVREQPVTEPGERRRAAAGLARQGEEAVRRGPSRTVSWSRVAAVAASCRSEEVDLSSRGASLARWKRRAGTVYRESPELLPPVVVALLVEVPLNPRDMKSLGSLG